MSEGSDPICQWYNTDSNLFVTSRLELIERRVQLLFLAFIPNSNDFGLTEDKWSVLF